MKHETKRRLEMAEEDPKREVFSGFAGSILSLCYQVSKVKRTAKCQRGLGSFTFVVFGTIFGALFYAAYHILPFFYYYYELQSHMEQIIKVGDLNNDKEVRRKLHYYMVKYKLPITGDDLRIVRKGRYMSISVDYDQVFAIPWTDGEEKVLKVFHFDANAEGEY